MSTLKIVVTWERYKIWWNEYATEFGEKYHRFTTGVGTGGVETKVLTPSPKKGDWIRIVPLILVIFKIEQWNAIWNARQFEIELNFE